MYKIYTDADKNLIRVELEGFWSIDDFERYIADETAALATLRCAAGEHLLLCDLSKLNVVAQDLVENVMVELNSTGSEDPRWLAIVCRSALLKLQFQRLLSRPRAEIFDSVAAAEDWLFSQSRNDRQKG